MKGNLKVIIFYIALILVIVFSVSTFFGQTKAEKMLYSDIVDYFKTDMVVSFLVDENYYLTMKVVDKDTATFDENGIVTAVNRGVATVTATVGNVQAECIVRVAADAPEGSTATVPNEGGEEGGTGSTTLTISHTDVTISSSISESFTISVRGTSETPEFSVGDTSVATVNASGKVTAVAPGRTTVYATIGDVKLSCIVRVT